VGTQETAAFVVFATVAAITPGPSNAMLMATAALVGFVRALPCVAGVACGMSLMMLIAGAGLATLIVGNHWLLIALKACGVAFLLWLAWKTAFAPLSDLEGRVKATGFAGAAAFQWINPKAWLVSGAAAAAYVRQGESPLAQGVWIAALFFAVALLCGLVWLGCGALLRRFLRSPERRRMFNYAMAGLLALSAALLV
jgi:threonine/homoserine/homoserine lactone efflux protein